MKQELCRFANLISPIFGQPFHFEPPENTNKAKLFRSFQGV